MSYPDEGFGALAENLYLLDLDRLHYL